MLEPNEKSDVTELSINKRETHADADAQLFSTLCEIDHHNYLYLFERCQLHHVNERQLRYLKKYHIRSLIPETHLGILAEFEYKLRKWQLRKEIELNGTISEISHICTEMHDTNTEPLEQSDLSRSTNFEQENIHYPLTEIIPVILNRCKEVYQKNNDLLTEFERRLLAATIIDYFIDNKIHLGGDIFDDLAEQIVAHFPTEIKRSWHDRKKSYEKGSGRLCVRFYNSQRKFKKRKPNRSLAEDPNPDLYDEKRMRNVLEDMQETIDMWLYSINDRGEQLQSIQKGCVDSVQEILEQWPAYRGARGNILLNLDFEKKYPNSMKTFHQRWKKFKNKIVLLMEIELRDDISIELFKQFKNSYSTLSDDSIACTLLNLLHAITKPTRSFNTYSGVRRYSVADSQASFLQLIARGVDINVQPQSMLRPLIFVIGQSLLQVQSCWVTFRDIEYELKFREAFIATLQLHMLFKLDFPPASLNFWIFVRDYLFDLKTDDGPSDSVMDYIISFIETNVQ